MATPSKRVALAPVNINVASPLNHKHKPLTTLPLTPTHTPKLALPRAATCLTPDRPWVSTLQTTVSAAAAAAGATRRHVESFSEYRISNSRNVRADLAATKLKLRLQLAVYKLKLQRQALLALAPKIAVARIQKPQRFAAGANVNLQRRKLQNTPSLAAVAALRKANLRLYHIKKLSAFHNAYPAALSLQAHANTQGQPPAHIAALAPTSNLAQQHPYGPPPPLLLSQRLPPVHKILKTPIKAANRLLAAENSDETIDESTEDNIDLLRKREDILGSSPLRHSFGTPNSFLVAKSLLQLGLGFY